MVKNLLTFFFAIYWLFPALVSGIPEETVPSSSFAEKLSNAVKQTVDYAKNAFDNDEETVKVAMNDVYEKAKGMKESVKDTAEETIENASEAVENLKEAATEKAEDINRSIEKDEIKVKYEA